MYIVCWKDHKKKQRKLTSKPLSRHSRSQKRSRSQVFVKQKHIQILIIRHSPIFVLKLKISFDCTSFLKKSEQKIKYLIYDKISKAYPLKKKAQLIKIQTFLPHTYEKYVNLWLSKRTFSLNPLLYYIKTHQKFIQSPLIVLCRYTNNWLVLPNGTTKYW